MLGERFMQRSSEGFLIMEHKPEWLEFENKILKIQDIDFFEVADNVVYCNFHQGMKYEVLEEIYASLENSQKRFSGLKQILQVIECSSFSS